MFDAFAIMDAPFIVGSVHSHFIKYMQDGLLLDGCVFVLGGMGHGFDGDSVDEAGDAF